MNHSTNGLKVKHHLRHTHSTSERRQKSASPSTNSDTLALSAPASSLSNAAEICRSIAENYAKVGKVTRRKPRPDNLSLSPTYPTTDYDSGDEELSPPPVPDSEVYGRLQAKPNITYTPTTSSATTCLPPPPIAFCDSAEIIERASPAHHHNKHDNDDAFKDYIDIDKPPPNSGTNNNNTSDTMSFYSDNYMRTGTLDTKRSSSGREQQRNENYLSPILGGSQSKYKTMDRCEATRQSIYSTNSSSGISVGGGSIDVSMIQYNTSSLLSYYI